MKLTLISLRHNGKMISRFVMLPTGENGKVRVPHSLIDSMNREIGCAERGGTFSLG